MSRWLFGEALSADGVLRWGGDVFWTIGAVVLALVVLVLAVGITRSATRTLQTRLLEGVLWAAALGLVAVSLADPQWIEASGRTEPGRLVVLVDSSRSMGTSEGTRSRGAAVPDILDALPDDAEVFSFADDLSAGAPNDFNGRGTNLGAALASIADRYLGQAVRGVVVITDGIDRGGLRKAVMEAGDGTLTPPALPGPVTFYQVGEVTDLKDLSVHDVTTPGFAFLRTPFALVAAIQGEPGRSVPVTLRREGRLADTANVTLDDEGVGTARFEVTPTDVGRFVWEVMVPVDASDAVPGNNVYPTVVRVVRDRIRVLQVSGSPSYDQKFLRLFLKEDPSVDLVSFFILRTHQDFGAGWHPDELSLIAFPYQRLFSEDLTTFDLVILQNFDYKPYFEYGADQLLDNLASFVRQGGALVMVGGDRSFDLGEYGASPLADVLPVELGVLGPKTDGRSFLPSLTASGSIHPLTRLAGTEIANGEVWSHLPEMDGFNLTKGTHPDAAVLLSHPTVKVGGAPAPVLAVREVGRGRTMALMVDASWRWSFSEAGRGQGNQAYLRFWKGAMRWLMADPDDRRVVVTPSRENVIVGDEVQITATVRNAGYGPVDGTQVTGVVETPDGGQVHIEVVTDASGQGTMRYRTKVSGTHRVRAWNSGRTLDQAQTVFSASERDPELSDIMSDGAFLARLASLYGERGAFRAPGDTDGPLIDQSATRTVAERRQTSLAAVPLTAVLFSVFASLAWWVRRRAGDR